MAKRELIDRNNLESTTIVTDDFSGNEVLDVVLMEDVKEAPVITEQEIVKPYLEAIEKKVKELAPKRGMWEIDGDIAKETVCEMIVDVLEILHNIDNLLSEQEVKE